MHRYYGDNVKYELLLKYLLQRKQQYSGWRNGQVPADFWRKQGLPVIKWNKKYSSKHAVSITHALEKKFFAAATIEGLWVVSF